MHNSAITPIYIPLRTDKGCGKRPTWKVPTDRLHIETAIPEAMSSLTAMPSVSLAGDAVEIPTDLPEGSWHIDQLPDATAFASGASGIWQLQLEPRRLDYTTGRSHSAAPLLAHGVLMPTPPPPLSPQGACAWFRAKASSALTTFACASTSACGRTPRCCPPRARRPRTSACC